MQVSPYSGKGNEAIIGDLGPPWLVPLVPSSARLSAGAVSYFWAATLYCIFLTYVIPHTSRFLLIFSTQSKRSFIAVISYWRKQKPKILNSNLSSCYAICIDQNCGSHSRYGGFHYDSCHWQLLYRHQGKGLNRKQFTIIPPYLCSIRFWPYDENNHHGSMRPLASLES